MSRIASRELFPTDEPLSPERMIGRAEDVEDLTAQLRAGVHRILAAPRRTGKNTVCRAAVARIATDETYTVSASLFELTTAAALSEQFAQRTLANRGPLARLVELVRAGGEAALKGAALTRSIKASTELGDGVEVALRPGLAARDPQVALLNALRMLSRSPPATAGAWCCSSMSSKRSSRASHFLCKRYGYGSRFSVSVNW